VQIFLDYHESFPGNRLLQPLDLAEGYVNEIGMYLAKPVSNLLDLLVRIGLSRLVRRVESGVLPFPYYADKRPIPRRGYFLNCFSDMFYSG
jgi:hypothetical protein